MIRWSMKNFILSLFLIVISFEEPCYQDCLLEVHESCYFESCDNEYLSDGYSEAHPSDSYEEPKVDIDELFKYILRPSF